MNCVSTTNFYVQGLFALNSRLLESLLPALSEERAGDHFLLRDGSRRRNKLVINSSGYLFGTEISVSYILSSLPALGGSADEFRILLVSSAI
jgi:hypothetical protein